jgi:hypothetical protein
VLCGRCCAGLHALGRQVGEMSSIVESGSGLHLILRTDVRTDAPQSEKRARPTEATEVCPRTHGVVARRARPLFSGRCVRSTCSSSTASRATRRAGARFGPRPRRRPRGTRTYGRGSRGRCARDAGSGPAVEGGGGRDLEGV